jgi:hypothetical protein
MVLGPSSLRTNIYHKKLKTETSSADISYAFYKNLDKKPYTMLYYYFRQVRTQTNRELWLVKSLAP